MTTADVTRLQARLSRTPTTANRVRCALSKAFALAETWGYRPRHSDPRQDDEKFKETTRERFLSPAEFATLAALDVLHGGRE